MWYVTKSAKSQPTHRELHKAGIFRWRIQSTFCSRNPVLHRLGFILHLMPQLQSLDQSVFPLNGRSLTLLKHKHKNKEKLCKNRTLPNTRFLFTFVPNSTPNKLFVFSQTVCWNQMQVIKNKFQPSNTSYWRLFDMVTANPLTSSYWCLQLVFI